jgi:F0F1-type ATP synthase membrane subunit c/vacuolar-type H+-ATPase subunit K
MLASIVLFVIVAERSGQASQRPEIVFLEAMTGAAVLVVIAQMVMRRRLLAEGARLLAEDPTSIQGLTRWQTGYIVSYAFSEAVALFGLVLRFTGFTLREVAPFYIAGFVLMLLAAPRALPEQGLPS